MALRTVAVDATVVSERTTGVTRFLTNLLRVLPERDPDTRYVALATRQGAGLLERSGATADIEIVPFASSACWELFGMGAAAGSLGAGLCLTLRETVGFGGPPTVMHVFEPPAYRLRGLGRRVRSDLRATAKDVFLQARLGASLRRAAAVTAGSRTTAGWLHRRYGIDPVVIPPGIEPEFLSEGPRRDGAGEQPYLLHLASGDPRQDSRLVIRAFALAHLDGVRLVLAGSPDPRRPVLESWARREGIWGSVEILGWVPDEGLRALYRGALAVIHPSRYESFGGYPALEAMAAGTAVVALRAPGVTEALEGAALLLDREDPATLARGLFRLARDPAWRSSLERRGRERVERLTWEAASDGFASVFRRCWSRPAEITGPPRRPHGLDPLPHPPGRSADGLRATSGR